jgi:hypothetical protein
MKCQCEYLDLNESKIVCDEVATKKDVLVTTFDVTLSGKLIDRTFKIDVCDSCYQIVKDIKFMGRWKKK